MNIVFLNNPERLMKLFTIMIGGIPYALLIFLLTIALALPLGLPIALGRLSKRKLVRAPLSFYIYVMRSTPLILQLMCVYYILPQILPFRFERIWAVVFAFVINYAAYFAEIFRGGIQSIPQGQHEAAQVLGYTKFQTFIRIILPQVIKQVLPSVTNEVITLVKDTALASTVAIPEILVLAKQQVSNSNSVEPYLVAMIFYLILNGIAEKVCNLAEKKMSYY